MIGPEDTEKYKIQLGAVMKNEINKIFAIFDDVRIFHSKEALKHRGRLKQKKIPFNTDIGYKIHSFLKQFFIDPSGIYKTDIDSLIYPTLHKYNGFDNEYKLMQPSSNISNYLKDLIAAIKVKKTFKKFGKDIDSDVWNTNKL